MNFKCYSSEELITLNTLHEVVPTWYSFHSWVDWSNADKVSCSRRKHIDAGDWTVNVCFQNRHSNHYTRNLRIDAKWRSSKQHVREILETCAFIVRWQSNVKLKFFTDCLKGIWALPIVIEVGRLWRCLVHLEVTSMSSVLLSLSLSMFAVAQALTSLIHDCIEWSSSDILSGGAHISSFRSSGNKWCMTECESIMFIFIFIY